MSKTVISDVIKKLEKEANNICKELEPMYALQRKLELIEDAIGNLMDAKEKEEI